MPRWTSRPRVYMSRCTGPPGARNTYSSLMTQIGLKVGRGGAGRGEAVEAVVDPDPSVPDQEGVLATPPSEADRCPPAPSARGSPAPSAPEAER